MYSIIIDNTRYDTNIVKTCELINIGITNSQTKISYSEHLKKFEIFLVKHYLCNTLLISIWKNVLINLF